MIRQGPAKTILKRKEKTRIIRRHLLSKSPTTDTGAKAVFTAYDAGKKIAWGTRKIVRGYQRVKKVKNVHKEVADGTSLVSFAWKRLDKKGAVKKAAKEAAKNVTKNAGKRMAESLYREGTEDSAASAVHGVYETSRVTKDMIQKGKTVYKIGRKINLKHQARKARKKELLRNMDPTARMSSRRAVKKMIMKQRKEMMRRMRPSFGSAVSNVGTKILKSILNNPKALLILGAAGAVFLIICILPAIFVGIAGPTQMIMADQDVVTQYTNRIEELDADFQAKIDNYQKNTQYDDVEIEYMGEEGQLETSWQDIISLMSSKFEQNLTFSTEEQTYLDELYNMMRKIQTKTETYSCGGGDGEKPHRCTRLIVQVYSYSMEDIIDDLDFRQDQKDLARELATSDWASMFPGIPGFAPSENFNPDDIISAPNTSATREKIKQTALSLVGKVPYFWGGKSPAGINPKWGTSALVTAAGSSTTGTYQPYGLDCSGYLDWVYKTAGAGNIFSAGGTAHQWQQSYAINQSDLKPGDLAFLQPPNQSGTNHVGIYVGQDQSGRNLYCHSTCPHGVTVNSFSGFKFFRRPLIKFDGEDGGGS